MKIADFVKSKPELLIQVKSCNSQEEFLKLMQRSNIEFEDMDLKEAYAFLRKDGELDDSILNDIAGGGKVQGTGLAPITEDEARKRAEKGEHIVQLNEGFYRLNGESVQFFNAGYYKPI